MKHPWAPANQTTSITGSEVPSLLLNSPVSLLIQCYIWSISFSHFYFLKCVFIYFWLHWVFVALCGLSLAAVSRGYSSFRCTGFSAQWLHLLQSTGSRGVAHGLSCSSAGGIFPDQRSDLHPLHWQVDSYPLPTTREVHSLSLKNRFRFAIRGSLNCSQLCVIFEIYIDCR